MSKELRIVLVGKTGVGKSASGNTILGRREFKPEITPMSLPPKCEQGIAEENGWIVHVIDTRGLFGRNHSSQIKSVIEECMKWSSPGPHVFLVVIQLGRFTQEELETIKLMREIFGEKSAKYTMALFTHGDSLENITMEEYLSQSNNRKKFIAQCQGGYHVFENKNPENRSQVTELLQKIDRMVTLNGEGYYTLEMYQEAEKMWREEEREKCFMMPDYYTSECNRAGTVAVQQGNAGLLAEPGQKKKHMMAGAIGGAITSAIACFTIMGPVGAAVGAVAGAVGGGLMGVAGGAAVEAAVGTEENLS